MTVNFCQDRKRLKWRVKRMFDLAISIPVAFLLLPLFALISLLIRLKLGSPIFFSQDRPGLDGKLFTIYKFRTMQPGSAEDALRMTEFGSFLRRVSFDEIPQLWNILKGDMSLVGPRPLLPEYLPLYSHEQAKRHEAPPGLTGWAQIKGRNNLPWDETFRLDVWYVQHWTPVLDLKIIFLTIFRVVSGKDVSSEGHCTRKKFMGQTSS